MRLVTKLTSCDPEPGLANANFKGKLDKTGLPDKQGMLEATSDSSSKKGACVKVKSSKSVITEAVLGAVLYAAKGPLLFQGCQ